MYGYINYVNVNRNQDCSNRDLYICCLRVWPVVASDAPGPQKRGTAGIDGRNCTFSLIFVHFWRPQSARSIPQAGLSAFHAVSVRVAVTRPVDT